MKNPRIKIETNDSPRQTDTGEVNNFVLSVVFDHKNFLLSYAETFQDAVKQVNDFIAKVKV